MGSGVLRRNTLIYTTNGLMFRIPKGTKVFFCRSDGVPTVRFDGLEITLMKVDGCWLVEAYGCISLVEFPNGGVPYPCSYFKN